MDKMISIWKIHKLIQHNIIINITKIISDSCEEEKVNASTLEGQINEVDLFISGAKVNSILQWKKVTTFDKCAMLQNENS